MLITRTITSGPLIKSREYDLTLLAHIFIGLLTLSVACLFSMTSTHGVATPQTAKSVDVSVALSKSRINWDKRTLTLIQPNGVYGRITRLPDGQMVCSYDVGGRVWVRHSRDEGKTWQEPVFMADWPHGILTNAELLPLRDGTILCFYNARPRKAAGQIHAFAIGMARSKDGGKSWQAPTTLYTAGTDFSDGCWEPVAIQLASGEVQLFFANENPYRATAEQEITLMRSLDSARTWSAPETVSFRAGSRDGMPVPVVLREDQGIAMAIEDNGLSGNFKPVVVWTSAKDNWRSGVIDAKSRRRWSALQSPLPASVYAGAPYLRQMPSGDTILSFQQSDNGDLQFARMVVGIGDAQARNFGNLSYPFPHTPGKSQLWNSLFVKNNDTITAISQTEINGVSGIWSIDGRLVREAAAATR